MTSSASLAGIQTNGLRWRYEISGIRVRIQNIKTLIEDVNTENAREKANLVGEQMREIANAMTSFFESTAELKQRYILEPSFAEEEMMSFFGQETPTYEFENSDVKSFENNFNYFMDEIYDIADYERAIVK